MSSLLDNAGLQNLLNAGELLLLPQAHPARLLRARMHLPADTDTLTRVPLAWHEWTTSLWAGLVVEGLESRLLLNRLQEEHLWAEVLRTQPFDADGTTPIAAAAIPDLARLARSGLQSAAERRIVRRLRPEADTVDSRAFAFWLDRFLERTRRDQMLPSAFLEEALAQHARHRSLLSVGRVHLIGFEDLLPSQQELVDALREAGTVVLEHAIAELPEGRSLRQSCLLPDAATERRFAVRTLERKARELGSSRPRLAVICPQPAEHRQDLERLFRELLAPELEMVTADLSATPWLFATPPALGEFPAIIDALDLLRWTIEPLSLERIGQLLVSPFLGFREPLELRARFDVHSPRKVPALRGSLDLSEFVTHLRQEAGVAHFPELQALARAATKSLREKGRRSPAEWTEQIRRLLQTVGWPGQRSLSAAEFGATQAWEGLLDLLATLQFDDWRTEFAELLDLLQTQAGNTPLPTPFVDAPVQVLTMREAEGLTFDLVVHLEATDVNLPVTERRHPLLPQALQRRLGVGDPAECLAKTRRALDSLARRSGTCLLLASADEADGETELTPLAAELGFSRVSAEHVLAPEESPSAVSTKPIDDPDTLPLTHTEPVRGGVDVLRLQAACGFHAFATYRLAADDDTPQTMGIDAREGGTLLHAALELLWQGLGTQATLRACTSEERRQRAHDAVRSAMAQKRLVASPGDSWSEHYLRLLEHRFSHLLLRWMKFEMERTAFTVLAQEREQELTVGPIRLKVRLDRVDEVPGGLVFVDYKSSYELAHRHWLERRPEAPQLPLYALSADPELLRGIAFAQVRPGDRMGWISLTDSAGVFPKARSKMLDLRSQLEAWQVELTRLAEEFAAGQAQVNPKSYPQTCEYCAHRLLCRLDPSTLLEQETDDDEVLEEDTFG